VAAETYIIIAGLVSDPNIFNIKSGLIPGICPTLKMDSAKRVVLRLRSREFDNGSPQEIFRIFLQFLEAFGYDKAGQGNHFYHAEPPQPEPRQHFHITIDINYRNDTPDMDTVPFEFYKVNQKL
jgi:hypothetical protein